MAPQPRIGTRLRRAIERKRMDQADVARALGVSRSAVNAWVNDRTYPRNAIGALEALLDVDLTSPEGGEVYTDAHELAIWEDESLPEDERRELIADLRERRRRHDRRKHDRRAG
jgi:transcriptional regulator with XRE-family HTH domain